jgi:hypothetical protein
MPDTLTRPDWPADLARREQEIIGNDPRHRRSDSDLIKLRALIAELPLTAMERCNILCVAIDYGVSRATEAIDELVGQLMPRCTAR